MKKIIMIFLALCLGLCACQKTNNSIDLGDSHHNNSTETPKIDTMYPDDVVVQSAYNVITVEKAEADLRANKNHESLRKGVVTFDKLTFEYPDHASVDAIFWFDISIPYEFGNENYSAKVRYHKYNDTDRYDGGEFILMPRDIEIRQEASTFTQMGKWKYDDGETRISIDFIRTDDDDYFVHYIVQYEITYYASYRIGGQWVDCSSDGEKRVPGHNEWDGDNYYLSIDLGNHYDESGEKMDLGYIKVYPWGGVYWDALHADGGPYKLSN